MAIGKAVLPINDIRSKFSIAAKGAKFKESGTMIFNKIKIAEDGDAYDRKEIALAIRN